MEPRPHPNEVESRQSKADRPRGAVPEAPSVVNQIPEGICGDFNMRIARDGTWFYRGSPIGRIALVKLFSTVLHRKDDGTYWLTTPVESGRIEVEDAPFLAVELFREGRGKTQTLRFRTNIDEMVTLDDAHALRIAEQNPGEPRPYIFVKRGLEARLVRPVFYELVEIAEPDPDNADAIGIWSAGKFFPLGKLS
jgi:hypothetical protein